MKATVKQDIIVKLGKGDTEINDDFPRNVGLERLRWDGSRVVDLARLDGFWVGYDNAFILHCKEFPNTKFIEMRYRERHKLVLNGGTPRLSTQDEIDNQATAAALRKARAELARLLEKQSTIYEFLAFILGWIAVLSVSIRTNDTTANLKLDNNLDALKALPLTDMLKNSNVKLDSIKRLLENFYSKVNQ